MNVLDAVRRDAVAALQPRRATLRVDGPDARSWLNAVVTCDLGGLGPGRAAWGLVLTKQGKILSDLFVVDAGERLWVGVTPGTEEAICDHLDRMLVMEDADIALAPGHLWLFLYGTRAGPAAAQLVTQLPGAVEGGTDWTGLGGAVLVASASDEERILAQLTRAGRGSCLLQDAEYQSLRHERAIPQFGLDYDGSHTPHDAALDHRAVSWSKGCYVGQEVVCMQDMRGKVRRRLAPLELPDPTPPEPGTPVLAEGGRDELVGEVTSGAPSADGQRALVLARLKTASSAPGTVLTVAGRPARVRDLT